MAELEWFKGKEGEIGGSGVVASQLYREAHRNADTDQGDKSIHHTLGEGPYQSFRGSRGVLLEENLAAYKNSFLTGWTPLTLTNGWAHFGVPYPIPRVSLRNNSVIFSGLIKDGVGSIATLPPELAPDGNVLPFTIGAELGTAFLEIDPSGEMNIIDYSVDGGNGFVVLDQIRYELDQ